MNKILKKAFIFVGLALFSIAGLIHGEWSYVNTRKERMGMLTTSLIEQLEAAIIRDIQLSEIFRDYLTVDEGKYLTDFSKFAKVIEEKAPEVKSLQLAPNGEVKYIYPELDNEAGEIPLITNQTDKEKILEIQKSGQVTFFGTDKNSQGREGFAIWNPISISGEFWGFSSVIIDIDDLINEIDAISGLLDNYYVQITVEQDDETTTVFSNAEKVDMRTSVVSNTLLENDIKINLFMMPRAGWITLRKRIIDFTLTVVVISALYILSHAFIKYRKELAINREFASHDALTNVLNKRSFEHHMAKLDADRSIYELYYIDLDNFKLINDNYGHDTGDLVLVEVTRRIRLAVDEGDLIFRLGGDEFVILRMIKNNKSKKDAFLERLRTCINHEFKLDDNYLDIQVSIGVSQYPQDGLTVKEVLKVSDQRMYYNKRKHKLKRKNSSENSQLH